MLPQLIRGTLDDVTISSEDVALECVRRAMSRCTRRTSRSAGMPTPGAATATVVLDEEQLRTLLSTVEDFPAESLGLAAAERHDVDRAEPVRHRPARSASR